MQQICHQLRCYDLRARAADTADADEDDVMDSFDEISQVVPYVEVAHDCNQNLDDPQLYRGAELPFRAFKTHAWAPHCPKFRRVIVVVRDPFDVVASFHRFFEGWFFEPGAVGLDDFAAHFWLARDVPENRMQNASYFVHLRSWYERATGMDGMEDDDDDAAKAERQHVLFVCFEDMVEDLEREVRRVARFVLPVADDDVGEGCGMSQDEKERREQLIRVVTERSSFDFMKAHASKFDEHFTKLHRNAACGLPPPPSPTRKSGTGAGSVANSVGGTGGGGSKIGLGRAGGAARSLLSEETKRSIQQKWEEIVAPVTGCPTYEDFRRKLKQMQTPS